MKKLVLFLAFGFGLLTAEAQTAPQKIGFADVDYIFSQLPEQKAIDAELKSTQTQLKNQIDVKYADFQKKLADYQANLNTMLEAVRANTERELQQMQQNIEKLQADAQTSIQTKQTQLMDPVYKKVAKGIDEVAKENGFSFVLNQQIGGLDVVLYGDEKMDVSDLVLKKLGVTPKPVTATTPPATTQQPKPLNSPPK
ncbi:MAG: OmpH family outer membrane protein [Chryseolinea sp.]